MNEKKILRRTKLRFIALISVILIVICVLAIYFVNYYYKERRMMGGNIEINQKVPNLVRNDFSDENMDGIETQQWMFILHFDAEDDYEILWSDESYHPFIEEHISEIYEVSDTGTFIDEFLITKMDVDDVTYHIGFDQSDTIGSDMTAVRTISITLSVVTVVIIVILYFASSIILMPIVKNARMQKIFVDNTSHDLKTPLSIIEADSEIILERHPEDEEALAIQAQVKNMNSSIQQLLNLSKIDQRRKPEDLKSIDISDRLNNLCSSFDAIAYERGITFSAEITEGIEIKIIPDDLDEICSQLLDNAFKYVDDSRVVRVSLGHAERKNTVLLEVYNTGSQLKSENAERIFDRFYRENSSQNAQVYGTGIGLSIVKSLCDLYGFTIEVKTEYQSFFKILIKLH